MDDPKDRSAHTTSVPTLGGMGIYITFTITIMTLGLVAGLSQAELMKLVALVPATLILLVMGIKDDLVLMSPQKKLLGQLFAATIIIFLTDIRITHFWGLLGIQELPYLGSVLFTLFVFALVINALNLVDGIDGLASSITVMASTVFGIYFMLAEEYVMVLISFTLLGSVIGFLYYNLSNTQKLFMGDSGSMLLGFLVVVQAVGFLEVNLNTSASFTAPNAPVLLLALLSYPLFDTLRVFALRVWQRRSPFSADRNHIHHQLLDLGLDHEQTTLVICMASALLTLLVFLMGNLNINAQLLISVAFGVALYLIPFALRSKMSLPKHAFQKNENGHFFTKESEKTFTEDNMAVSRGTHKELETTIVKTSRTPQKKQVKKDEAPIYPLLLKMEHLKNKWF